MKLNNRGWGLQAMLLGILVLMIALIIVAVLVNQLGKTLGIESKDPEEMGTVITYKDLENKAIEGAKKYQDKYYSDMQEKEKITVTVKTLKDHNMLDDIVDINDKKECTGYVIFTLQNETVEYYPYLRCSHHTTKGYLEHLDI